MKFRHLFPVTLTAAIVGCAQPFQASHPAGPSGAVPSPGAPPIGYQLKQTGEGLIATLGANASSTRDPRWFAPQNAVDGNLRSAWGPAADDAGPTLNLYLGEFVDLSAIALKLSGATAGFAVEAWVAGAWVPVRSDVRTTEAALETVELPTTRTNRFRLRFAAADAASLLVCKVQALGSSPPFAGESPLDCFSLPGTQSVEVLADSTRTDLIAFMTLTDLLRTPTSVGGTVTVTPAGQPSGFTGPVTSASSDGTVLTLSGTLTTGGPYSADLLVIRQDSPTTLVVAPIHYFALISPRAAYTFEDPTPGELEAEQFTLEIGCD